MQAKAPCLVLAEIDWSGPQKLADEALEAALRAADECARDEAEGGTGRLDGTTSAKVAMHAYDAAYKAFADMGEIELLDITGEVIPVLGKRGRTPVTVWAPLVAKKVEQQKLDVRVTAILKEARLIRDLAIDIKELAHGSVDGVEAHRILDEFESADRVHAWDLPVAGKKDYVNEVCTEPLEKLMELLRSTPGSQMDAQVP